VIADRIALVSMRLMLGVAVVARIYINFAAAQNSAVEACPRPAAGTVVPEPEDLASHDGVLKVQLTYRNHHDAHGQLRYCYLGAVGKEAPLLRLRPGDLLILTLKNDLKLPLPAPAPDSSMGAHTHSMTGACGGGEMNSLSTNLHFHGLTIPPVCKATATTPAVWNSTTTGASSVGEIPASAAIVDYVPHHNPFQYYSQTANPHHLPPTGTIGPTDQANHQYDLSLFLTSITNGQLPTISFVKAKKYQNGHPGNSDPLDEQTWLVQAVNAIQDSPYWRDTVIIITYDDSDGWHDHQMDSIVNQSSASDDALWGPGTCGTTPPEPALPVAFSIT